MSLKTTVAAWVVLIVATSEIYAQQPQPALTMQRAIQIYLDNSLEVQSAQFDVERVRANQIAARLRPNPGITLSAENLSVSGPIPFDRLYEVIAIYSETIELGGKRALRETAAESGLSAAEARFEDVLRRGVAEVKRLYYAALLARYNLEVAVEDRRTFDQLVQFNSIRFQEGAIPELELIRVRLEQMKFESALKQAQLALRRATILLLEKLALDPLTEQLLAGELALRPLALDRESLRMLAMTERADVRAASQEFEAATARLNLERARAKPDIVPFAGYKRIGHENTLLGGITVQLKVRDRNQGGIARAETDVRAAETQLQLSKNRALAEVEIAFEALRTAQEAAHLFQDFLLRQADDARTITLAAYEEGGTDLLPVLEAQRTRAEVRQQYFKTLFDYGASVADLGLAVGRDIE